VPAEDCPGEEHAKASDTPLKLLLQLLLHELHQKSPKADLKVVKADVSRFWPINVPLLFDLGLIRPPSHPLATPTSDPLRVSRTGATEMINDSFKFYFLPDEGPRMLLLGTCCRKS
jgi:hypothetical protein